MNNLKIVFDTDEVAEISYDDTLLIGKTLRITTAKDLKTDSEINSELNTDTVISKLATIGKMPVVYSVAAEEYIQSTLTDNIKYKQYAPADSNLGVSKNDDLPF